MTYCIEHSTTSRSIFRGARYQEAEDSWACGVDIGDPIRSQEAEQIRQQRIDRWMVQDWGLLFFGCAGNYI